MQEKLPERQLLLEQNHLQQLNLLGRLNQAHLRGVLKILKVHVQLQKTRQDTLKQKTGNKVRLMLQLLRLKFSNAQILPKQT